MISARQGWSAAWKRAAPVLNRVSTRKSVLKTTRVCKEKLKEKQREKKVVKIDLDILPVSKSSQNWPPLWCFSEWLGHCQQQCPSGLYNVRRLLLDKPEPTHTLRESESPRPKFFTQWSSANLVLHESKEPEMLTLLFLKDHPETDHVPTWLKTDLKTHNAKATSL